MSEGGAEPSFVVTLALLVAGALLNALLTWIAFQLWQYPGLRILFLYPVIAAVYGLPLLASYRSSVRYGQLINYFLFVLPAIYFLAVIVTMIAGVASYSESDASGLRDWADPIYGVAVGSALSMIVMTFRSFTPRAMHKPAIATVGTLMLVGVIAVPLIVVKFGSGSNYFAGLPEDDLAKAIGFPLLWQIVFALFAALMLRNPKADT